MAAKPLFHDESPVALRQPKTDLLILSRYLKEAADDRRLNDDVLKAAHEVLVKWADLETSGRLDEHGETQIQGDFLAQVFGEALGYEGFTEGRKVWHREQHHNIGGETPDAVLGFFRQAEEHRPLAVVELKGPAVHLDRHRSNGRTAVDQCWDYLVNTPPECRWGIVSNVVSFRLYERSSTKNKYEHFTLQSLRGFDKFKQFYVLFHRQGLIDESFYGPPRAVYLLKKSADRQREVGEKLYKAYSENRTRLIQELHHERKYPLDQAIEMAQRLIDRIVFIAFCEDRGLLPGRIINEAYKVAGIHAVTNPRWRSFKNLFHSINVGNPAQRIPRYNGGLFAPHPCDDLDLDDSWTNFFKAVGEYDFADEVNLDVLGHLFERSITELEKLKQTGLFADAEKASQYAAMPQSAKRKRLGIYYTPPELTSRIVQYTVEELIVERFAAAAVEFGVSEKEAARGITPDDPKYWRRCLDILRNLKIVDPACGSGAFLFQAYDVLEHRYNEVIGRLEEEKDARRLAEQIPRFILNENLYGVDLSPEAVEITQLALWIRSASRGQLLEKLSKNIIHGNSLVHDPAIHADGFDWRERFPDVFLTSPASGRGAGGEGGRKGLPSPASGRGAGGEGGRKGLPSPASGRGAGGEGGRKGLPSPASGRGAGGEGGFDCVIGNPPWERMDLSEREFFSLPAPDIATATTGAERKKLIASLAQSDVPLYQRYLEMKESIDTHRLYCSKSGEYPLTGRGRTNFYATFAELASQLVAPAGRVGLLVPSGIASDKTTMDFFASVAESNRLIRLYDFENRLKKFFPEVDGRFKFSILNFGGEESKSASADFVFFAHRVEELEDRRRHIALSGADIRLLNPNTRTCPIFRTRRDAEITKAVYRRVPILIDRNRKGPTANPWGIKFKQGIFNQTSDSHLFREPDALRADGFKPAGNRWVKGKKVCLPLYEAKMVQAYDHRAANVVTDRSNWVRQGQTEKTSLVNHQNPEYLAMPRFWIAQEAVSEQCGGELSHFLCFKDVTSPTNQRTMIGAMTPFAGIVNSAPIILTDTLPVRQCCLLGNLNSFVYDFVMRQKISNVHLNFFIVEQVPTLTPDAYAKPCPWDRRKKLEKWIGERVLKLTCTAEDMLPLADACGFTGGSFKAEYGGRLNKWDEAERAELMAELDAAYFHLYGLPREDVEYVLSTFKGIHDPLPLLPGGVSVAERIVQKYGEMSFPA